MRPDDDPAFLTPAERFRELAGILAAGILRLRDRAALAADPSEHFAPENPEAHVYRETDLRRGAQWCLGKCERWERHERW